MTTTRRRTILAAVALAASIATAGCGGDDKPAAPLKITWGGAEGDPACRYHPEAKSVTVQLTADGDAGKRHAVSVTVGAYADENTSIEVGSTTKSVVVEGEMHERLVLTIPVTKAPFIGEDDIVACKLAVKD